MVSSGGSRLKLKVLRSASEKASFWIETNLLFWKFVVFLMENILPAECNRGAVKHNFGKCFVLISWLQIAMNRWRNVGDFNSGYILKDRLRWSRGSVLAFSTQVHGFEPGRSRRIFRAKKILSMPSFGGEVKLSVPCRRFTACKRSLNLSGSRNLGKITGQISRPQFHLSLLGSLASLRTYRHLAAKVGTSKGGRKQWQTIPKNLPRMQCARAIPVTGLGSGSCQPGL